MFLYCQCFLSFALDSQELICSGQRWCKRSFNMLVSSCVIQLEAPWDANYMRAISAAMNDILRTTSTIILFALFFSMIIHLTFVMVFFMVRHYHIDQD